MSFTDHATTNTYYAIKDHQNTVIALTDRTGSVVESYDYDAYGRTKVFSAIGTELTASAYGNRYCFQGREIVVKSSGQPGCIISGRDGTLLRLVDGSPRILLG